MQGNRERGLRSVHNASYLLLLHGCSLPLLHVRSLPQDAILLKLLLHRLLTDCSSPSAAPTWLCTTGPTLQECTAAAQVPTGGSSPSLPFFHHRLLSVGCSPGPKSDLAADYGAAEAGFDLTWVALGSSQGANLTAPKTLLCKANTIYYFQLVIASTA